MFSIRENGGGGAGAGQGYAPVQQEQGAQRGRWLTTCAVALMVTAGCTGAIEGVGGNGGPGPSGPGQPGPGPGGNGYNPSNPPPGGMVVDPGTGPVVIPPVPPDDAPITGNFASAPGISSRFQRLSHRQWENTIADLFKGAAPVNLSRDFLSEPIRSSFNNNGSVLEVSTALWQDYQNAASTVGTAARETRIHGAFLNNGAKDGKTFIRNFGMKAYRRPLTDAEVNQYDALFTKGAQLVGKGDAFADGVEVVVEAMLQSPHFLYRTELGTNVVNGRVNLSGFEVASRLSYGITNSMPDEMLFAAAQANKLTREEVINQARRLVDSERGKATMADLHEQMFKLTDYGEVKRDVAAFPEFKPEMGPDIKTEAHTFLEQVVFGQNKGVEELLTAPYSYVNGRLAPLYGANVPASQTNFVKVDLDPKQRAGLYTQLGFLATTATDQAPRSIIRGVHVSLDALCVELPAPPNVPPENPEAAMRTNRQMLEAFTEAKGSVCEGCHAGLINPLGFAFENYDGLGKFRTTERSGLPIDASGKYQLSDGEISFTGAVELMKAMAAGRQAHDCYAQHLFEYLYGREKLNPEDLETALKPLALADAGVIGEVGRRSRMKVSIKNMIVDLVSTDAFLTRLP
jgi:hypothetical protein